MLDIDPNLDRVEIKMGKKPPLTDYEHPQSTEVNLLGRRYFIFPLHSPICNCLRSLPLILCVQSVLEVKAEFLALSPEASKTCQVRGWNRGRRVWEGTAMSKDQSSGSYPKVCAS